MQLARWAVLVDYLCVQHRRTEGDGREQAAGQLDHGADSGLSSSVFDSHGRCGGHARFLRLLKNPGTGLPPAWILHQMSLRVNYLGTPAGAPTALRRDSDCLQRSPTLIPTNTVASGRVFVLHWGGGTQGRSVDAVLVKEEPMSLEELVAGGRPPNPAKRHAVLMAAVVGLMAVPLAGRIPTPSTSLSRTRSGNWATSRKNTPSKL